MLSYELCELKRDAKAQLNIAGENYHVYVYDIDDELNVSQVMHKSFPAKD